MLITRETEKAYLIEAEVTDGKKIKSVEFWAPKSQVKDDLLSEWILGVKLEELSGKTGRSLKWTGDMGLIFAPQPAPVDDSDDF